MRIRMLLIFGLASGAYGCATVNSLPQQAQQSAEPGLQYYLPRNDFIITVDHSNAEATSLSAAATGAYPDYKHKYVAQHRRNAIGDNDLDVSVTRSGLLTDADYRIEQKLGEALEGIATTTATEAVRTARPDFDECNEKLIYTTIVRPESTEPTSFCGFTIKVSRAEWERGDLATDAVGGKSGFYYRQPLPYFVAFKKLVPKPSSSNADCNKSPGQCDFITVQEFIAYSTNESPVYFLPLQRVLFAKNDGKLVFEEGVPQQYHQSTTGEVVGAIELPARILKAYFSAIGAMFSWRSTPLKNETAYLEQVEKLIKARLSLEQCEAAKKSGDMTAVQAACGQ